ncbi:oxygenase MpaB family protein [Nocardia sp. CNY236]|uniref:oxygenase MpaB family protein n=1 Tax=Nocardia sp. CNY236 TaxID=1169152 RepID=UPI0004132B10|nr:oxygenase MpaB family protein [Nocardia sp. CNY236]
MPWPPHTPPRIDRAGSVELERHIDGIAGFLGGTANVIMQLSAPPVGRGVVESTVDSGKVMLHPIKRLRTTLTYLSVTLLGTDAERAAYRQAVDVAHRPVRSGASSPVRYNAFDPTLQLWVAACLYWGAKDLYERMHGPMDDATADAFFHLGARMGTTLQMPHTLWPANRRDFDEYWARQLANTSIDPTVRAYLHDLVDLRMLPRPVQLAFGRMHRFVVTGLLPAHLRCEMGLTWSQREDQVLDHVLRTLGAASAALPQPIRVFPYNAYLLDMRLRRRLGRPLV